MKLHVPTQMHDSRRKLSIIVRCGSVMLRDIAKRRECSWVSLVPKYRLIGLADRSRRRQSAVDEICPNVLSRAHGSLAKRRMLCGRGKKKVALARDHDRSR